jgi:carbon-monoxide dehydrogenase medium subunit
MHLPSFEYLNPKDPAELAGMLAQYGKQARILAGGTDLLVQMKDRALTPEYVIDIGGLGSLATLSFDEQNGLVIGTAAKMDELLRLPVVKQRYSALWTATETVGARQIIAMSSIGGNICNASPAADTPPALCAFDAEVRLSSSGESRTMPLLDFILGNRKTALQDGEYLESITLPTPAPNSGSAYHHFRVRGGMEIAMVAVAVNVQVDPDSKAVKDSRIILGIVAPTPIRASEAEQMILGQVPDEKLLAAVGEACAKISTPIDDFRASEEYRKEMLKVLFERAFEEAYSLATSEPKAAQHNGSGAD